ncbi:MAG TPA: biotin--[acetyl-CoA-carboxylase] ligase [Gaiellaceae bacterium]|jgi:BirA family biotin operon repressor/biotin-[acetyl-CoA-carboxylase] ligase|nr:biotin--[acetyl-CoA-carboxylase] ligase [Gaiellaceae bacterium]
MADSVAPETIVPALRGRFGRPYRYADVCASTQRLLEDDDEEGAVAVTDEQSEGRGRLGRTWHAPAGTSILLSVLLRPDVPPARLPELSVVAGRAVAAAIRSETPVVTAVKLPNDVLVGGRKVAGVLAEATDGRVVLGIGVNVNQTADELPAEAQTPATSLRVETGGILERGPILVALLEQLERAYDGWLTESATSG